MKWIELQKRLLAAARRNVPADRVPLAFEKRVMARLAASLKESPQFAEWLAWTRALWLGAAACTVIALATSVWVPAASAEEGSSSFSEGVEQSIMVFADDLDNAW